MPSLKSFESFVSWPYKGESVLHNVCDRWRYKSFLDNIARIRTMAGKVDFA